mmetsp:Transcript_42809/g.109545  ORF Transcript_42809/g.109545 Transcript_42809/m.109545 type:complete len:194 (-) Transcript_42809:86-667(-)
MPAEWQLPWDVDKRRTDAKKGPYSEQEHAAIHRAFTHYCSEHNLPTDNTNWLSENRSSDARGLWKYVARALPHRTIHSVCHAGHRLYAPRPREGKWEPHEDAQLLELVSRFGKSWVNVGQELGRYNSACRDRWKIISVEGIAKVSEPASLGLVIPPQCSTILRPGRPGARSLAAEVLLETSAPAAVGGLEHPV